MAAPALRANSATLNLTSNTGTIDFGSEPAGWGTNDILIAIIACNAASPTITPPADITWTSIGSQGGSGSFLQAFWARRGSSAPSYSFSGPSQKWEAFLYAISGAITSGSPIDPATAGTSTSATGGTAITISGVTTTVADVLLLMATANNNSSTYSGWAMTDPASPTELHDQAQGSVSAATAWGTKTTAGATGNLTITAASSGTRLGLLFGIKPPAGPVPVALTVSATGTVSMTRLRGLKVAITATGTGTPSMTRLRTLKQAITATATGTASFVKQVKKNLTVASTGSPVMVKMVFKIFTVASTGTPTIAMSRGFTRTLTVAATGTAIMVKQVGKKLTTSATGTPSLIKRIGKNLTVSSTGTVSSLKAISKTLSVSAIGSALLGRTQDFHMTVQAIGTAVLSMRIGRSRPSSLQHEYNQSVVSRTVEYGQRVYRKLREYGQKVSRDGN